MAKVLCVLHEDQVPRVVRMGVLLAAVVALIGGTIGIVQGAAGMNGRAWIQLGVLLSIATLIAWVVEPVLHFIAQQGWPYVAVTLIVLAALALGMIGS